MTTPLKFLANLPIAIAISLVILGSESNATPTPPPSAENAEELTRKMLALTNAAKYREAAPLALQLVSLRERAEEAEPVPLITSLNYLALIYINNGEFAKAEPVCERALRLCDARLPAEHFITAETVNSLGLLYYRTGRYAKAEPVMERALRINEKVRGPEHYWTGLSLNNLALLLQEIGDYTRAEPLFVRALAIFEKIRGPEDQQTALTLNNLGLVYFRNGQYAKAKPLFDRALKIYEKVSGPDHPSVAVVLNNLALISQEIGDYEKAEPLCRRVVSIYEKTLGPDHPDTALSLNNLALLLFRQDHDEEARRLLERVIKIYEKSVDANGAAVALALGNLAIVLEEAAKFDAAETSGRRAAEINEKIFGENHPQTAMSWTILGKLRAIRGDYPAAEALLKRAEKTFSKVLGPDHSYTALSITNVALLYIEEGAREKALESAGRAREAQEKQLANILSFASEQQRLAFQKTLSAYDLAGTLGNAGALAETVLRHKGVVLDSLLEDRLVAEGSAAPEQRQAVEQLRSAKQRIAQLLWQAPNDLSETARKERATEKAALAAEVERLETNLARYLAGLGKARRSLAVTVGQVQAAIPSHAVLVELIRYRHYLGKRKFDRRYGAVVLAPKGEPRWVPLGRAQDIEKKVRVYRQAARGQRDEGALSSVLKALGDALWEPIEKVFPPGTTEVVISPDAELSFLSFATLLSGNDRFIAEQYSIRYVASGRDLLRQSQAGTDTKNSLCVFANADFSSSGPQTPAANPSQIAVRLAEMRDWRLVSLPDLPGTARESADLEARAKAAGWETRMAIGANATETTLRETVSPRILHLATHGFFLPELEAPRQHDDPFQPPLQTVRERLTNPMHRSGLALSSAQTTLRAWAKGEAPPTEQDGIVTAEEVSGLKLEGTWLVVLSACDTGSGEAQAGEGVIGLRRGFIQAGTQNLLMTLWPISDETTVQIMSDFYDAAFKTGDAPQSLANTQRDWLVRLRKEKGLLAAVRLAGPFIMSSQGKP